MSVSTQVDSALRMPFFDDLSDDDRALIIRFVNTCFERVDSQTQWYSQLGDKEKQYLHSIVLAAINDYMHFARNSKSAMLGKAGDNITADHLFDIAPLETTRAITLENVIETIRIVVRVLEEDISLFAPKGQEASYVRTAMYYSREIAFSAAQLYGRVAATRSIWDTRDEAFIIESLLHEDYSPALHSRVAKFSWDTHENFFALVGGFETSSNLRAGFTQVHLRNAVRALGGQACITSHDESTVVLIGMGTQTSREPFLQVLSELFTILPTICLGPICPKLEGASRTLRAAVNCFNARHAYPHHPNPLDAHDMLAERALFGDLDAQDELYANVYQPLKINDYKTQVLSTLQNYLLSGSSLDVTAQTLNVHPNTIRYRLKKVGSITGYNPALPQESYVLLTAIKIGLYRDSQEN